VARYADACNVFGTPAEVAHKFDVLREHCAAEDRDYHSIEKTCWLRDLRWWTSTRSWPRSPSTRH
jgi:hypothetical protein